MSRPADSRRRPAAVLALVAGGVGLTVALAVPAAATAGPESWAPEIALAGGDDRGVELVDGAVRPTGPATGELVLAPRRTGGPVSAVSGAPAAETPTGTSVVVQARGLGADGRWGPWATVPRDGDATLPRPTGELSVRVLLRRGPDGAVPVLRGLWLTTSAAPPRTTTATSTATGTRTSTSTSTSTETTTVVPVTTVPTTTTTTGTSSPTMPSNTTTTATPTSTTTVPPTTTTTVAPTATTTTPVPPPGLVLDLPPDPPYTPTPVTPAAATDSWWGDDLLGWLARAF